MISCYLVVCENSSNGVKFLNGFRRRVWPFPQFENSVLGRRINVIFGQRQSANVRRVAGSACNLSIIARF
jgi:hypothetical protein